MLPAAGRAVAARSASNPPRLELGAAPPTGPTPGIYSDLLRCGGQRPGSPLCSAGPPLPTPQGVVAAGLPLEPQPGDGLWPERSCPLCDAGRDLNSRRMMVFW